MVFEVINILIGIGCLIAFIACVIRNRIEDAEERREKRKEKKALKKRQKNTEKTSQSQYISLIKNNTDELKKYQKYCLDAFDDYEADDATSDRVEKFVADVYARIVTLDDQEKTRSAALSIYKNEARKRRRILVSLAVAVVVICTGVAIGVSSCTVHNSKLLYELNETGYTVSAGKYYDETDVVIPSTYNGKKVTKIANSAFSYVKNKENIKSITIPNSVTSIGSYAFSGCASLTSVTIPNSVTSIGGYAFEDCAGLTSLTMPLPDIDISGDYSSTPLGEYFSSSEFTGSYKVQQYPKKFFGSAVSSDYYIPNSLKQVVITKGIVPCGFFSECATIESVTLPPDISSIEQKTFFLCGIKSITLPATVKKIENQAFSGCAKLESLTIPSNVEEIYGNAFSNCTRLSSVTWNARDCGITYADSQWAIFSGCDKLKNVTVGAGVQVLPSYAFYNCSLTRITIPGSVTSIGKYAFGDHSSLRFNEYDNAYYLGNTDNPYAVLVKVKNSDITSCEISGKTKFIYNNAFYGCSSLTGITIPNSVTSIGSGAFYSCSKLTNVTIPNSVTSIEDSAFYGCSGLTNIMLPDSLTSIGEYAFCDCTSLTDITIPSNVTSIGSNAFKSCSSMNTVWWNAKACTDAGGYYHYVFTGCKIYTINIGKNVQLLPEYVFYNGCVAAVTITYQGTIEQWRKIEKESSWKPDRSITVTCTDGQTTC